MWGWGRRRVYQMGRWLSINKFFIDFSPAERLPFLEAGMGTRVTGRNVRVFVHRRYAIECQCIVMQLVQMCVSSFVYVCPGGCLDLEEANRR